MENTDDLEFRKLDFEGLKTLIKWAEDEGWNPGEYDAEVFWTTDPDGFYGYFHKGEMIGGGSVVVYDPMFGFMGFFIVKPAYRARGIGQMLWYHRRDILLSRLNKEASIGMDGVLAMQPFYRKGGFEIAFRDERHEKIGMVFHVDHNISAIAEQDTDAILAFDLKCFGFPRPAFMKPWLKLPAVKTFKYVLSGTLKGFAVVRKVKKGYKVCPLFADNAEVAEELYKACLNSVAGEPLYIDIPVVNSAAIAMVRKYNTNYVFECARMYFGRTPQMDINKVFGITTFELG
jgi:GNAT superfamily N-acetyltransferase